MVNNLSILCGLISAVFILLNALFYFLRDLYYISNNNKVKVFINKILPYLAKYNSIFILIIFLFAILHIILMYSINGFIISSGYVILFVLLILIKFYFFSYKKLKFNYGVNILAYLLFISLFVHYVFKI